MEKKLTVSRNKTLKLTNAVSISVQENDFADLSKNIIMMDNYIKSKGYQPVGPLIQHTGLTVNNSDEVGISIEVIRQATGFINNVERPYKIESTLRVRNCYYVRYCGAREKLKFAYDKLALTAFEEDVTLKGDSYSIFLEEGDDQITVDVFMECED